MTWGNRLRLTAGLVVVLALVLVCTVVFNQRQNSALSDSATIIAQHYPVGTDYGGLVVRQFAQAGDEVSEGDPLFEIRSFQLQRDIASGYVVDPALATSGKDGTNTITATVDGTLSDVTVVQGGFAQAGSVMARIDRAGSMSIEAEFVLTPRDYARIARGAQAEILLPNQDMVDGTVTGIDVATVDGKAASTVIIDSEALGEGTAAGLFQPGTPVSVTLRLRDDGPLAGLGDALHDFLRKVGL